MSATCKGYFKGQEFVFDLPKGWNLLSMAEPRDVPGLPDVGAAVRQLLAKPIGTASLAEHVKKAANKKTVIVSEDQLRPTPIPQILLPLLAELNKLGVADSDVDVIIGVGTHRHPNLDEIKAKIGAEAVSRLRVSVHNAEAEDTVYVGTTTRGTVVKVNKLVAEASLVFAIGTAVPHYFAGYGGGPKLILPGVSSRETIKQNHVWIRDAKADVGILDGNPIWEDMVEAARLAGLTMKFDTVLNSRNEIYKLFGGEVEAEHRAAVEAIKYVYGAVVPSLADITITCAYPLESDLIQSGKALLQAGTVTKPGGTIVLTSACRDGAGPGMYETLSQRPTDLEVIQWIAEGKANTTSGPMVARIRTLVKSKKVVVVTEGVDEKRLADMEFGYASCLDDAIAKLSAGNGKRDIIVLPVGGTTFPYLP